MGRDRAGFIMVAFLAWTTVTGCSEEPANVPAASETRTAAPSTEAMDTASSVPATPEARAATPTPVDTRSPEELIAAGRATYNANCIACHAMDPRIDGALGPAVAGASAELIAARVLRAEYPEGYKPARETRVMVPLPHLEAKLPELTAYLASLE